MWAEPLILENPVTFMKKTFLYLLVLGLLSSLVWAQDATTDALLAAVKSNPNSFDAHFNLGVSYFNGRQYDLAAPEFKRALDLRSNDSQSKEMYESSLGIGAYLKGDYPTAIPHLKNVLAVNPKNPNANMLLGNAYVQTNDYKKAPRLSF